MTAVMPGATGIRPCRSNRVVFRHSDFSQPDVEQLGQELAELGGEKVVYALVTKLVASGGEEPNAADSVSPRSRGKVCGLLHLASTFLKPQEGGVTKWRQIFPSLGEARFESAANLCNSDWKTCLAGSSPAAGSPATGAVSTLLLEIGSPAGVVRSQRPDAHYASLSLAKTMDEVRDCDPRDYVRYHFQYKHLVMQNKLAGNQGLPIMQLNRWQWSVHDRLMRQNDREILFVVDHAGARGKSALGRYLKQSYRSSHLTLRNVSSGKDLAHLLSKVPDLRSVAFDFQRSVKPGSFPWSVFEELKDGGLCSGKYEGACLDFPGSVKVVVFTNHCLGFEYAAMLTADRIAVIDLDKEYADRGPDWFKVRFASSELAAVAATGTVEEMGPMSLSLSDSSSLAAAATVAATSARQCPTCGHVLTEAAAEPSTSLG